MRHFKWQIVFGTLLFVAACGSPSNQTNKEPTKASPEPATSLAKEQTKNILFFGNSLTAGYGLESQELAFPGIIQQWIDSLALPYRVINGGLSGETTAAGKERIDWLLREKVDIFVLELGANDGLRGIPTQETSTNLQEIIDKVKTQYPDCKMVLTGMMVPPSMGGDYGKAFTAIFPALAEENDMAFVPFLLADVAGETDLNQQDGIHPTEEGHQILAEHVWEVLEPLL
ncbi:arylesterase [Parapedobacter sp. 10938]|uniref:arylesterase n=1 Tax=Parapedobacter flavus TaxID=3110225 RepID=UPI002DBE2413|nr:arylesterase [Parapedobacter sp. 10938]MEC3878665.1 arylesterase [Parapedobacter sp. 10938]